MNIFESLKRLFGYFWPILLVALASVLFAAPNESTGRAFQLLLSINMGILSFAAMNYWLYLNFTRPLIEKITEQCNAKP